MKKLFKSLAVTIIVSLVGYSSLNAEETAPLKLTLENAWNEVHMYYYPKLKLTSISDDVTVEDVIVNRGGCNIIKSNFSMQNGMIQQVPLFPQKLKYGRSLEVRVKKGCDLIEVQIDTSKGKWTYNFQ